MSSNTSSDFIGKGDFIYRDGQPIVFSKAAGSTLTSNTDALYLDAGAANGTVGLGYDASIITNSIANMTQLPSLPSFCESEMRLQVAKRLEKRFSDVIKISGRVSFDLGGAQGIELALKIAHANNFKKNVVVFEGGYHGRSYYTSLLSSSKRYREFSNLQAPVIRLPTPNCAFCRFGKQPDSCKTECIDYVKRFFEDDGCGLIDKNNNIDVCAVVIEPILNVGGMAFPDPRYFKYIVDGFRERGALIIVDEIFTGLYRSGSEWGFEYYDIKPDIVVISKGISNGLVPISGVWAREPLLDPEHFLPGTHSITYGNNPVSFSIVNEVLNRYYDSAIEIPTAVENLSNNMRTLLFALLQKYHIIDSVAVRGGIGKIVLKKPVAARIRQLALHLDPKITGYNGIIIASTGIAQNVIALHPPFLISDDEIHIMGELLNQVFEKYEHAN